VGRPQGNGARQGRADGRHGVSGAKYSEHERIRDVKVRSRRRNSRQIRLWTCPMRKKRGQHLCWTFLDTPAGEPGMRTVWRLSRVQHRNATIMGAACKKRKTQEPTANCLARTARSSASDLWAHDHYRPENQRTIRTQVQQRLDNTGNEPLWHGTVLIGRIEDLLHNRGLNRAFGLCSLSNVPIYIYIHVKIRPCFSRQGYLPKQH
jgi:hypothetical protein